MIILIILIITTMIKRITIFICHLNEKFHSALKTEIELK